MEVHISKSFDEACKKRIDFVSKLAPGSKIHLSAVCGTGMAAVLSLLKQLGFYCTGSDKAFYPPMGEVVRNTADKIFEGYSSENISKDIDLVVIGNALSRGNPEVEYVLSNDVPFASMPEVFAALLIGSREDCQTSIVAAGTHGKTTTSAMIATLLEEVGRKPGYFMGGMPKNLSSNIRPVNKEVAPQQRVVVLEGDEYDSAFFAKFSKFHCYRPDILIVTSLEFDHADIYASIEEIKAEFFSLAKSLPESGVIFICANYLQLREIAQQWNNSAEVKADVVLYGTEDDLTCRICSREVGTNFQRVTATLNGEPIEFSLQVTGQYNALNAFASILAAKYIGIETDAAAKGIAKFQGVARRQQLILEKDGYILMEDFAHHPTAVQKTLQGFRESYPEARIIAVFEPRSNTSRRAFFQYEYGRAFLDADIAFILDVKDVGSYSKTEQEIVALDVEKVVEEVIGLGTEASKFDLVDDIASQVCKIIQAGDLVVLMSNGDFGGLPAKLKQKLGSK